MVRGSWLVVRGSGGGHEGVTEGGIHINFFRFCVDRAVLEVYIYRTIGRITGCVWCYRSDWSVFGSLCLTLRLDSSAESVRPEILPVPCLGEGKV